MLEHMREAKIGLLGRTQVKAYIDNLRTLLSKGTLIKQKAFLRSFVKRIKVEYPRLVLDHTPKYTKGKTTHARSSAFCRVQLPIMDSLRNQLTAPSEEILGTLAAMPAMVSPKSGAYG